MASLTDLRTPDEHAMKVLLSFLAHGPCCHSRKQPNPYQSCDGRQTIYWPLRRRYGTCCSKVRFALLDKWAHSIYTSTLPVGFVAWVQQLSREQQLTILRLSVSPGPNVVDRAVMVAAIEQSGLALAFASDELRADHDVVRGALEMDGYALQYVSDELKSDQNFVMVAVTENGLALEFASDGLKEQVDVVLAAVKQDGLALEFASEGLKDKMDVVLAAVRQNYAAAEFVSEEMKRRSPRKG